MTVSAYYQMMTSFSRQDVLRMCPNAFADALPVLPLRYALIRLFTEIHPQFRRNDDLDNEKGANFTLTNSPDCIEKIVNLFMKRRMEIMAPSEDLKLATQEKLKSEGAEAVLQRILKIEEIAAGLEIKKVAVGYSLPIKYSPGPFYSSIGGQFACLGAPMIIITPSDVKIEIDPTQPAPTDDEEPKKRLEQAKTFCCVHEMVHIKKSHTLISTISHAAFAIFTSGIWMLRWQNGLSPTLAARTYVALLGPALLFQLFYNTQRRCQEMEADLGAIKYLGSSEGAILLFESIEKRGAASVGVAHPTPSVRLAYIRKEKID
jgi:hypothetical protein